VTAQEPSSIGETNRIGVIFCAVAFIFYLGGLLSKQDIGSYRPISRAESRPSGCIPLSQSSARSPSLWFSLQINMANETLSLVHHGNWTDFSLPDENSGSFVVGPVEEGKDR
jgi:hypothetical protein